MRVEDGGEREQGRRLSIKQIAALAGVSVATVSRVMNRSGYVARETEARVHEVIKAHGYVPNLNARGLRTSQTPIIGLILPDITNEFYAGIAREVQTRLFAHRYSTLVYNTNGDPEQERAYLQLLSGQSISGLIHVAGAPGAEGPQPRVPTVYMDRRPARPRAGGVFIGADNEAGGYLAARELLEKGCRRIALVCDGRTLSSHEARREGYRRALAEAGLLDACADLDCRVPRATFDHGRDATSALVRAGVRFDGVFCTSDALALGAIAALVRHRVAVPEQVRLVGFDDTSAARHCAIPFTTVRQPLDEMGAAAVEALLCMIRREPVERREVRVPVRLVRRMST